MLNQEQNDLLTRVEKGAPAGNLLRRYWHPIAVAAELTEESPKKRVRFFGEDLVLFRLPDGSHGLLQEACSHRRASLYYGFIDPDGLRCPYHGWKYDVQGRCIEQPFERDPNFKNKVCHPSYPVEELSGLLFAYFGPPEKKPLLPNWDLLAHRDWPRKIEVQPVLNCNWLQPMENSVDPSHTRYLHGETLRRKRGERQAPYTLQKVEQFEYETCEWGIWKRRIFDNGEKEIGHLLLFPNILRHPASLHFRVPIDDTHTQIIRVIRIESGDYDPDNLPIHHVTFKNDGDEFHLNNFASQDAMAWETQGPITERELEMLGDSDRGIITYRKMLRDQIELVMQGGEPMAIVRDPEQNRVIEFETSDWRGRTSD
ncbi:MAG: Rieske 2Fe-2S domain-containing protein [Deltaproteobacteria bacterium]|nr:Rieske 2Fe-2S domain-containing protein [Deltaproteobacteria bacterium]